ncbi:hypothetical protein HDV01_001194 [Terramyces sp. JEL0728]|nr:hypothetical protein HDV01_001194 [Terramyces sp. JEL0728]
MYYCYTASTNFDLMTNLYQANQILFALASLFTVLISSSMLLIFMRVNTPVNFVLMIVVVLLLHFGFCAPLYGYNFIINHRLVSPETLTLWINLQVIWVVAMYFIDLSPHVFVFGELIKALPKARRKASIPTLIRRILRYDSFMVTLLFLQILNACWYMSLFFFTNLSTVLQSDENLLNMQGLIAFSYIFHAVLSCLLNQHLRELLAGSRSFNITASAGSNFYKPQRPPLIQTTYVDSYDYPYGSIQEPDQAYSPSPMSETSEVSSIISEGSYIVHPISNMPERKLAPNLRIDVTRLSLLDRRSIGSAKILTADPLLTSPILEALARNSNDHRPQSTYSLLFQQTKDEHERNSMFLARASIETPLSSRPRSYYHQGSDSIERNTPSRNGQGPQTYF